MHLTIDTTLTQPRQEAPAWENPKFILEAEQARKLHLKDGQIIHGLVKERSGLTVLTWNDQGIELPRSWAVLIGQRFDLVVSILGNEYVLKKNNINKSINNKVESFLINYKIMGSAESEAILSNQDITSENEASIGEAFAAIINNNASIKFQELITQISTQPFIFTPNWLHLFQTLGSIYEKIYSKDRINNEKISNSTEINSNEFMLDTYTKWQTQYTKFNEINLEFIKYSIENSGLTFERKIRDKKNNLESDLKYILLKIMQNKETTNEYSNKINHCISQIENTQLAHIHSLIHGYANIQFLLPMNNGDIWGIHIFNRKHFYPNDDQGYCLDIHSKNSYTGSIWLRTIFTTPDEINMQVWVDNNKTASLIQENKNQLKEELMSNHIKLTSLVIHEGVDPYEINLENK